jgi:diphthamide biosynthesis protein 7
MAFELPKLRERRSSSPSLRELSEEVQKKIDLYRSSKDDSPRSPIIAAVPEPANYTSRTLSDPIAAVEICPAYPDYMIIGTYALLKSDEPAVSVGQVRNGSVSVVPVAASFIPAYPGAVAPLLDEKCLNAAVLDIHFHPSDDTLFGVATSNAKMTFFRLVKLANVLARRVEMQLVCLGSIFVAEPNEHGEIPLITSFCWLSGLTTDKSGEDDYYTMSFAATVSNGDVTIVRAITPSDAQDERIAHRCGNARVAESDNLGKHSEEAWTAAATTIPKTMSRSDDISQMIILSGGDDSALIATSVDLNSALIIVGPEPPQPSFSNHSDKQSSDDGLSSPTHFTSAPVHLWTDRKSHTAGVVAILPLSSQPKSSKIPILTGSYDEYIRLFLLETTSPILKRSLILEKKLGGGVWRLKLMHESNTSTPNIDTRYSALILASCMHGGVRILRLTYTSPPPTNSTSSSAQSWHMHMLAKFSKGHESMNYGSDFRTERDADGKRTGTYTIVSTSFYDKAVCVWKFVDEDEVDITREGGEASVRKEPLAEIAVGAIHSFGVRGVSRW